MPIKLLRIVAVLLLILCDASFVHAGETIRIGAAISLREALQTIAADYEKMSGDQVELTFASSGQILSQIKNGAPIDAFISAASEQVDGLVNDGLAVDGSRTVIAGNDLVLIVPAGRANSPITSFESLGDGAMKKLAIGEPKTVPAGKYASQALEHFKLADKLNDRIIFGSNVRQVLTYVEHGEVSAGIVYASDAKESGEKVRIVATAPADSHDPIVYPAIVLAASKHQAEAKRFIGNLGSNQARAALLSHGFSVPGDESREEKPRDEKPRDEKRRDENPREQR